MRLFSLVALVAAMVTVTAWAGDDPLAPLSNRTFDMEVVGTTAYVGVTAGLKVVEVAAPAAKDLALVELPGSATDVLVHGSTAYVALGPNGVAIVDVSEPAEPKLVSTTVTNGGCFGLALDATRSILWIAEGSLGLTALSVEDPKAPAVIGTLKDIGYTRALVLDGDRLFVAAGTKGIVVVDTKEPESPKLIDAMSYPAKDGEYRFLLLEGSTLYAAKGYGGVDIIDVTDEGLAQKGSLDTPDVARGLAKRGSLLYVADGGSGIQILDVSTPTAPKLAGSKPSSGSSNKTLVVGDVLYVANDYYGLTIVPLGEDGLPSTPDGEAAK